jgi:regulatory protein
MTIAQKLNHDILHYCNYQERCHSQVRTKLYALGTYGLKLENIMAKLIEDNILNEERYAILFATSKFRQLGWGKIKIRQAMKLNNVSDYCIQKGLAGIDLDDYYEKCKKFAEKKWETLAKERNSYAKNNKVKSFLLQKGYEGQLVSEVVKELEKG